MSVPVGNVTVIVAARPGAIAHRSDEVAKFTKYTVRAPAAADGDEIVTVRLGDLVAGDDVVAART